MAGRTARPGSPAGISRRSEAMIRVVRPDHAVWSFSSQQAALPRCTERLPGFPPGQSGSDARRSRFRATARFDSVEWPRRRRRPLATRHPAGVSTGHRPGQGPRDRAVGPGGKRSRSSARAILDAGALPVMTWPASRCRPPAAKPAVDVGIASFATTSERRAYRQPRWGRRAGQLAAAPPASTPSCPVVRTRVAKRETVAARHRRSQISTQRLPPQSGPPPRPVVRRGGGRTHWRRQHGAAGQTRRRSRQSRAVLANGARRSPRLNRRISDAGWGQFVSILRAPKRKTLDAHSLRSTPAHLRRLRRSAVTPRERTAAPRPGVHSAHADEHARTQHPAGWTGPPRSRSVKES